MKLLSSLALFLFLFSCKKETDKNKPAPFPSVKIGNQVWGSKNLDVRNYRNGDPIPLVTDSAEWADTNAGAWCWYNNDSATYAATYGKLYNWYAVNDPRGLAPSGWHVPSDIEWSELIKYIDPVSNPTATDIVSSTASGPLKEMGNTHWIIPNTGATNNTGFTGLPGGLRGNIAFGNIGNEGWFWSSTEYLTTGAFFYSLPYNGTQVFRYATIKVAGCSVRCIRD